MTQSILQIATTKAEFGRSNAADLEHAADSLYAEIDRREVKALAHRVRVCNSNKNFIVSQELVNLDTGDEFTGFVQLWRCGSIFCPSCIARKSRENRRKCRKIFENYKKLTTHRFRFVTLTIPTPHRLSLRQTREIVNHAWTLLRKRKKWRSLVRAYIKSEEFTVTARGYHYHLHLVVDSKFLNVNILKLLWTDAVERAFQKYNRDFVVESRDGFCVVHIAFVRDQEATINELCKYVTKNDSWSKIEKSSLVELALVRRFNRMFEIGGAFRGLFEKEVEKVEYDEDQNAYVHTRSLSDAKDGNVLRHWRDDAIYSDPAISENFEDRVLRCQRFRLMQLHRKFGIETVTDLDGNVIQLCDL